MIRQWRAPLIRLCPQDAGGVRVGVLGVNSRIDERTRAAQFRFEDSVDVVNDIIAFGESICPLDPGSAANWAM